MSKTGSDFKPSINKNKNFSVTLATFPSTILPSSILFFDNWLFSNFANSFDAGVSISF